MTGKMGPLHFNYLVKKIQTVISYERNQGRVRRNGVMCG